MDAAGARRTGKKRKAKGKAKVAANASAKEIVVEVTAAAKPKVVSVVAQSKTTKKATPAAATVASALGGAATMNADAQSTVTQGETASTGKKSKKKRKKKKTQAAASELAATPSAPATNPPQPTAAASNLTKKTQHVAVVMPALAQKRKNEQIATSEAKASTIVTIGTSEKSAVSPKRKIVILNSSAKKAKLNPATTRTAAAVKSPVKKPATVSAPITKAFSPASAPESSSQIPATPVPTLTTAVAPKLNASSQQIVKGIKSAEPKSKQKLVRLQKKKAVPPSEKDLEIQTKTSPVIAAKPLIQEPPAAIVTSTEAVEMEKKGAPTEEAPTILGASSLEFQKASSPVTNISTKANQEVVLVDLPSLEEIVPVKTTNESELVDLPSLETILPARSPEEMPELISLPSSPEGNADALDPGEQHVDVLEAVPAISTPPSSDDVPSANQIGLDFLGEWSDIAPRLQFEPSLVSSLDTSHATEEPERTLMCECVEEKRVSEVIQPEVKREAEEPIEILSEDESDTEETSDIILPSDTSKLPDTKAFELQEQLKENQEEKKRLSSARQHATQLKVVEDHSILQSAVPPKQETHFVNAWGPSFGRIQVPPLNQDASSDIMSTTPLSSWFLSKGAANFIKRVVSPARCARKSRSPEKRVRPSTAPVRQQPIQEEAEDEDTSEIKRNEFLESLASRPAWRSWFTNAHLAGVLDPPLAHVPESVQSHFDAIEDPIEETQAEEPSDSDTIEPKAKIETLEEEIRREKERGKAFDQELLQMLQGRTLSGKDFEAEYAALLPTATTPT